MSDDPLDKNKNSLGKMEFQKRKMGIEKTFYKTLTCRHSSKKSWEKYAFLAAL